MEQMSTGGLLLALFAKLLSRQSMFANLFKSTTLNSAKIINMFYLNDHVLLHEWLYSVWLTSQLANTPVHFRGQPEVGVI